MFDPPQRRQRGQRHMGQVRRPAGSPPTRAAAVVTALLVAAATALLAGCGAADPGTSPAGSTSSTPAPTGTSAAAMYPDVVEAVLTPEGDGTFTVEVTMSSPYDTPERYADGWRVLDGRTVLGEKQLTHDHAAEQPFTRTMTGLEIPTGVRRVTVEGRDLVNGYGGGTVTVAVPGR